MFEVRSKGRVVECLMQVLCILVPEFFVRFACLRLCLDRSLCPGLVLIKRRKVSRSPAHEPIGVGAVIADSFERRRGAFRAAGLGTGP